MSWHRFGQWCATISWCYFGIVGGIIVGYLSQSHISVSGPVVGLTAIVLTAITELGSLTLLLAVLIAGAIQLALIFKSGSIQLLSKQRN
jgi:MFS superfamily sulfate permease-like transporter